jgi:hypothetical protein
VTSELVELTWVDSMRVRLGWATLDEYRAAMAGLVCKSVGYVIGYDEDHVLLVQSLYEDGSMCSEGIVIPRSALRHERLLGQDGVIRHGDVHDDPDGFCARCQSLGLGPVCARSHR